jgi:hypothetical protein
MKVVGKVFKIYFLFSLSVTLLYAYSDLDLDGVDDSIDQCPNTPITDLVDAKGCSTESVIIEQHYDIIFGLSFGELHYRLNEKSETYTTTVQFDYYRGDLSLQCVTSYFQNSSTTGDESGMNDTTIAGYYQWYFNPDLSVQMGLGVILPTGVSAYGSHQVDYTTSVNITYGIDDYNLFMGYNYTVIGDDNIKDGNTTVIYQNSGSYSIGVGYYFDTKLYSSIAYYASQPIYKSLDVAKSVSLYTFYTINEHWFTTFNYTKGLSDSASDNYFEWRIGYYF